MPTTRLEAEHDITSYDKFDSLKLIYENVYKELIEFRETTYKISVLYITLTFAIIAWLFSKVDGIDSKVTILLISGMFIITIFVVVFIKKMEFYFSESASVINKCQYILGAYTERHFGEEYGPFDSASLLPKSWLQFGNNAWREPMFSFCVLFIWILFVFSSLACVAFMRDRHALMFIILKAFGFSS